MSLRGSNVDEMARDDFFNVSDWVLPASTSGNNFMNNVTNDSTITLVNTGNSSAELGTNTTAGMDRKIDDTTMNSLVSAAFLLVFFVFVCQCANPSETSSDATIRRQLVQRWRRRMVREREEQARPKPRLQVDSDYRRSVMESSLMTKQVVCASDENGNMVLGDIVQNEYDVHDEQMQRSDPDDDTPEPSNPGSKITDPQLELDNDVDECTCAICLEPYRVGDVVAWSRYSTNPAAAESSSDVETDTSTDSDSSDQSSTPETVSSPDEVDNDIENQDERIRPPASPVKHCHPCLHVFHKECIEEWLLNQSHDDCPSCRSVLLRELDIEKTDLGTEEEQCVTEGDDEENPSPSIINVDAAMKVVREASTPSSLLSASINERSQSTVFVIVQGLIARAVRRDGGQSDKSGFDILVPEGQGESSSSDSVDSMRHPFLLEPNATHQQTRTAIERPATPVWNDRIDTRREQSSVERNAYQIVSGKDVDATQ